MAVATLRPDSAKRNSESPSVVAAAASADAGKCDVTGDAVDAFVPLDGEIARGAETSLEVQVADTKHMSMHRLQS